MNAVAHLHPIRTLAEARGALSGARGRYEHHVRRFEAACKAYGRVYRSGLLDREALRELAFGLEALVVLVAPARREVESAAALVRSLERAEARAG